MVLLLCAAPALAKPQPTPDAAIAAEAQLREAQGQFSAAAERFHDAFLARPLPDYLYRAGRAHWLASQPQDAIAAFERLLKLPKLPPQLKKQALLELAQLQIVQGKRPPPEPVKPPPPVVKPPPPPVAKPVPPPPKPPPVAVAPPAAATPVTAPAPAKPVVVDVPRPKLVITPTAPTEQALPAKPPEEPPSKALGIASLVVAGIAAAVTVGLLVHANTLQDRLDTHHLVASDAFDLTLTSKADAVTDTNRIAHWHNGALATGALAVVGVAGGLLWLTDDEPPRARTPDEP